MLVPIAGLEPTRLAAVHSKDTVSTNFTIQALNKAHPLR